MTSAEYSNSLPYLEIPINKESVVITEITVRICTLFQVNLCEGDKSPKPMEAYLRAENSELKAENSQLKAEVSRLKV